MGWGKDTGFIKQWRTTCNALEVVVESHRDCLLPLDELSQADSKSVGDMVYMLANNQGKARLKSSITLRSLNQWRVLILSSGEVTLQTKIEESGKKTFVGMEVRFVSLQADAGSSYGIFENLHEFANGESLSRYLKEASTKYYGIAIRAFLEQIVKNTTELIPIIKKIQQQFCETNVPLHASGQVSRVASRFGLLAAAGELATEFGILPFAKGEVIYSISKCFNS